MSLASRARPAAAAFRHEAFFYAGSADYAEGTVQFIDDGLDADDAILVAVPAAHAELIRQGLGRRASDLQFLDMAEVGRNPGRIIPLWLEFVTSNIDAGRTVRGIGEPIWAGRSAAALVESQWHESLLNLAFADGPGFPLLCPYDVVALPADVLIEAKRSHPFLWERGRRDESPVYRGVPAPDDHIDRPLSPPPANAQASAFGPGGLLAVRRAVEESAARSGLDAHRAADLVVAVNEAATNSLRHGGGEGVLRVWVDADVVVCEISDRGRIGNPMVGRQRRSLSEISGRGLWLVHQLCDLVEVRSGVDGTTVRMSANLQ
jgi:anti-sigma regulatory factor (Ser/Thr protein kinase)